MSMTAQEWQAIELKHAWREIESRQDAREVEPGRHPTKPRKPVDPMIYPAILAVLGVIGTLVMFVYAIRTADVHVPHRPSVNMMMYESEE
jgi:hypothetical protein